MNGGYSDQEAQLLAELFEKYFDFKEFDSPDIPGSGRKFMQPKSLAKYVRARHLAQIPFKVNSAYRSESHNKKVGGVLNSSHRKGFAFDTSTRGKDEKKIIKALIDAGFNRIGVYQTFIHADDDPDLPQNVAWNRFTSLNAVKNFVA
ncbi:MAG: peptidase M15 [Vicingaceae bacterium]|nr:peptidase M15 [Vicingaceae bacterium]